MHESMTTLWFQTCFVENTQEEKYDGKFYCGQIEQQFLVGFMFHMQTPLAKTTDSHQTDVV